MKTMHPKNTSKLCYSLYNCNHGTTPVWFLVLLSFLGIALAFIYDYILVLIKLTYGEFPTICWGGIHIHHLYFGIVIFLIFLPLSFTVQPKYRGWMVFFMSLGFGLGLSDIVSHLTIDPFLFYC